jgi:hypothetical protein
MRLLYYEVILEAVRDERSIKQRLLRISEIMAQAKAARR